MAILSRNNLLQGSSRGLPSSTKKRKPGLAAGRGAVESASASVPLEASATTELASALYPRKNLMEPSNPAPMEKATPLRAGLGLSGGRAVQLPSQDKTSGMDVSVPGSTASIPTIDPRGSKGTAPPAYAGELQNLPQALPNGGTLAVGSDYPVPDASAALKEYAEQQYGDTDYTNAEAQQIKVEGLKGRMANTRRKKAAAADAAAQTAAQGRVDSGTGTVDDAKRLGLLGGRSRYSEEFSLGTDKDGQPIKGGADAYVGTLNQTRIAQNEAEKDRDTAETVSANGVGLTKGRYDTTTFKDGKDTEDVVIFDTVTGQEVPAPGTVDTTGWSDSDRAMLEQYKTFNEYHSGRQANGKAKPKDLEAMKRNDAAIAALQQKYAPSGLAAGRAAQRNSAAAAPQTQAEFDALPAGTIYVDPEDGQEYVKK